MARFAGGVHRLSLRRCSSWPRASSKQQECGSKRTKPFLQRFLQTSERHPFYLHQGDEGLDEFTEPALSWINYLWVLFRVGLEGRSVEGDDSLFVSCQPRGLGVGLTLLLALNDEASPVARDKALHHLVQALQPGRLDLAT